MQHNHSREFLNLCLWGSVFYGSFFDRKCDYNVSDVSRNEHETCRQWSTYNHQSSSQLEVHNVKTKTLHSISLEVSIYREKKSYSIFLAFLNTLWNLEYGILSETWNLQWSLHLPCPLSLYEIYPTVWFLLSIFFSCTVYGQMIFLFMVQGSGNLLLDFSVSVSFCPSNLCSCFLFYFWFVLYFKTVVYNDQH